MRDDFKGQLGCRWIERATERDDRGQVDASAGLVVDAVAVVRQVVVTEPEESETYCGVDSSNFSEPAYFGEGGVARRGIITEETRGSSTREDAAERLRVVAGGVERLRVCGGGSGSGGS